MTAPLSRVEAIARREADATGRPHVVLNLNWAGAPLYVCRELRDGIEADRIVSRFDPAPSAPVVEPVASVVGEAVPAPSNATEGASCEAAPAYLAIQCQREGHPRGTFLYQGNNWRTGRLVSPVFEDSVRLYQWATANGWHSLPYDPAHPVGVYAQPVQQAQSVVPLGGRYVPLGDGGVEWVPDAPAMVPQPCQQQQARARGRTPQPARGERRYVTVRDTETGDVHRVLTSVAQVGVAVVIFIPSNRHRQGALGGMLITHDDIRKAWVFNDEAEARRMLSRNQGPGERVIRAELISDPAVA